MDTNQTPTRRDSSDLTPTLVQKLRDGDPEAGILLHSLYREPLIRYCWGFLGSIEEAEDAVQDIFCTVLGTQYVPDALRPWLYRIARNHCINLVRARARRKDTTPLTSPSKVNEVLTGQLTKLVRSEQQSRLGELVARLPDFQQEVLRLRYVEGLSRSEIAEVLELTEQVVKSRLFEGLSFLKDEAARLDRRAPG